MINEPIPFRGNTVIHRRADSFVTCTCFYIAEDTESSEDMAVRRTFRPPQHELSGQWPSEWQRGQVTSCVSWLPALAPALAVKIHAACRRYFLKGFGCRWLGRGVGNKFFRCQTPFQEHRRADSFHMYMLLHCGGHGVFRRHGSATNFPPAAV